MEYQKKTILRNSRWRGGSRRAHRKPKLKEILPIEKTGFLDAWMKTEEKMSFEGKQRIRELPSTRGFWDLHRLHKR